MDGSATIKSPRSVAEIEQLVQRLYKPGPSTVITQINNELQRLQLSEDGWKLADELMGSSDAHVRFFAALTFTVKLNNDGARLDRETADVVQTRLISWLVRLTGQGESKLVCKKLCSTLTTFFIRSPFGWANPICHLALAFYHGNADGSRVVEDSANWMNNIIPSLGASQLNALLWFSATLAEEVSKVDTNVLERAHVHHYMKFALREVCVLMTWSLRQSPDSAGSSIKVEALRCFLTWVNYAQPSFNREPQHLHSLRELIIPAGDCLLGDDYLEALDVFRDLLESYASFFEQKHMDLLAEIISKHIRPKFMQALVTKENEGITLCQFIVAFGCASIQTVVERPDNEMASTAIVQLHLDILAADGYAGDEDQLSFQTIEFWNTYIEYVNDTVGSSEKELEWSPQAKRIIRQVVESLWAKMLTPPNDIGKDWTDAEFDAFREFRQDSSDLMLSIFVFLGQEMLQLLVSLALRSLEVSDWRAVEAALYCLDGLADNVLEELRYEEAVGDIFRSSLFRDIADFSHSIPPKARRTAIDFLGSYGQYIERHAEFLPDTVRFLFASLEMAGLANVAAKSIASLCSACRASLTNELDGFLVQYQRFLASSTCDPYTKSKVLGAIAAIIQARTPESAQAQPLTALLEHIERDINAAERYAAAGDEEMTEHMGVTALECLAAIGRAMQVQDDVPIDIEETMSEELSYWHTKEGRVIQQRIVGCFSVLRLVGQYSAAVDATCQVIRSGLAETRPGPFVLPTTVTVNFMQQCSISTPQLESVLSTACMLITHHSRQSSNRIDDEATELCQCVAGFIDALERPSNDPGVAQGCIELLTRLIPHYTNVLLIELSPTIMDFALAALEEPATLPKRAAADFWTKLLKPQTGRVSEAMRKQSARILAVYGSHVARSLMFQIGGTAQRSDIDQLCEPLKGLLMHHADVQTWLQNALSDEEFPGRDNVDVKDRVRYVRQIAGLRSDGKKLKELSRAFWAACRGTVVSYGA